MQYLLQMGTHQHSVIWILDEIILHIRDVLKSVLRVDCIPQLYFMEFWDFHEKGNFFWNDEITAGYAALVRLGDNLLIFVIVNSISRLSNLYLSRSIHIKKLPKTTNLSINFIWPLNIYIRIMCTHCKRQRSYIQYMITNIQRKQYNNRQRLIYNWSHIEED